MTFIRGLGASSSDETEPTWQQKILSRIHILILHFAVPLCSIVLRYHLRVPGPFVKRRASFWSKESMGGWKPCKLSCARARVRNSTIGVPRRQNENCTKILSALLGSLRTAAEVALPQHHA
jgi:hypothetical protein